MLNRTTASRRRDYRFTALLAVFALVLLIGLMARIAPDRGAGWEGPSSSKAEPQAPADSPFPFLLVPAPPTGTTATAQEFKPGPDPEREAQAHSELMRDEEVARKLAEAQTLLDKSQYGEAVPPLARAIELRPRQPAAYVNMGYAQLGLGNLQHAETAFQRAIDLKPNEARAYFGLGIVYDRSGELPAAMGAMRSFLHLTTETDAFAPAVTRARSALWEWEAKLGRGPWGPTRGVPPGLAESDLQRDGQGVGMLAPQPDGTSRVQPRPPEHFRAPAAH